MSVLKSVMQALLIANDAMMRFNILIGAKRISIREGHRDFHVGGPVMICDHQDDVWAVLADITNVRHCTLREITVEEWEADGFRSQLHLLNEMRQYYPKMTLDSPVTVVRWANVRGRLVDAIR